MRKTTETTWEILVSSNFHGTSEVFTKVSNGNKKNLSILLKSIFFMNAVAATFRH